MQVNEAQVSAVLAGLGDNVGRMMVSAVSGQFAKPHRHVEALMVACYVAESMTRKCGGVATVLRASVIWDLAAKTRAAAGANSKVNGQLCRLGELLLQTGAADTKKRKKPGPLAREKKATQKVNKQFIAS